MKRNAFDVLKAAAKQTSASPANKRKDAKPQVRAQLYSRLFLNVFKVEGSLPTLEHGCYFYIMRCSSVAVLAIQWQTLHHLIDTCNVCALQS